MANKQQLKNIEPYRFDNISKEEHSELARKGGLKCAENRRERNRFLHELEMALNASYRVTGSNGEQKTVSGYEAIAKTLIVKAIVNKDLRAVDIILDRMYGKAGAIIDLKSSDGSMTPKDNPAGILSLLTPEQIKAIEIEGLGKWENPDDNRREVQGSLTNE